MRPTIPSYKPFKMPQHASSPTREGAGTSRLSCSSYTGFQSPTCSIQDRRAGIQGTAQPLACAGGRLPTCVCHWTPTTAVVGHRHVVPSAVNQHTFWRSLIRCCWTSSIGVWNSLPTQLRESDVTLGQFQRALKTHLFGHCQLQRRVTMIFVRCFFGLLTYLLTF